MKAAGTPCLARLPAPLAANIMATHRHLSHPVQHEPLRLRNNWGMACVFFAMWDALLLALGWWAIKRFGGHELKSWRVSYRGRDCDGGCSHMTVGMPLSQCLLALHSKGCCLSAQPSPARLPTQWWLVGGAALLLVAGEAAWSWEQYRREVQLEAERAAARLARVRARARHAAYCAAAAERVWPDVPYSMLPPPPPLPPPAVRGPAAAPEPAASRGKGVDSDLKVALLAEEWEP